MQDSLLIYIGKKDEEAFNSLGLGFPLQNSKESVSSSLFNIEDTESRDLAQKLSLRLKKPVFVSCNVSVDRISKPLIEQRLVQEITEFPEHF